MMRLEELQTGAQLQGLDPRHAATVVSIRWIGNQCAEVVYETPTGGLDKRLVYRDDEASLEPVAAGRPWSFDGDGELLRLVSEAYRIHLAWLFDPYVAITTSVVEPLPHQISAVYEEMLPRQPMRFLLADDPGAGKTIMAGLLVKELLVRGDLERCLIISPGSLTEQWQDELWEKFGLHFQLFSRDMVQAALSGNPFLETRYLIARMDQLARNDELQQKLLDAPEWDLVICDEAHRMSGHYFGSEVKLTKRYKLGLTVGSHARNFLLMTATPHNGKEEDFQLFLALLDGDRFEGRFRNGVHAADPSDLMRRLVKEDLLRFDGRPLFPERVSKTVQYELSTLELALYNEVTEYVREEMNRAERFVDRGEGQRRVNVGFALMTLQRRLASSPESIFRSLVRRRERLEARLREERILLKGGRARLRLDPSVLDGLDEDLWDDAYDEAPQDEREELEARLVDHATTAETIEELETEIARLKELEELARRVVHSGQDAKWTQLDTILDDPLMVDEHGNRRKLVIFSEFKDTLSYLVRRIRNRIGRDDAVVEIHGGVKRDERRKVVHAFMNDPTVVVLIANDAAGEGVNLQRAHLMVNYDLPWNPNRLEQRFGRIHRIGQREVCHLWNLIAKDTREGDVYVRLLHKLEAEREALGGKVFDVVGELFDQKALRQMLMEAVQYGDDPAVKARLDQAVDGAVNRDRLEELLALRALAHNTMDTSRILAIREEMERAFARRLQPHFVEAFFAEAFRRLGGKLHRREPGRYEVTHVPQVVRERDRHIGMGAPILKRYERVCFDKQFVDQVAELICPGSPLLDATIDVVLERHGDVLKRGAVLVDDDDPGTEPRLLFYLQHEIKDGRRRKDGKLTTVFEQMQFVEVGRDGVFRNAGAAPYLDYRPTTDGEFVALTAELDADWLKDDWEARVMGFAIAEVLPGHVAEVKARRLAEVDKVETQVKARLQREIRYWDSQAQKLKDQEKAGKRTRLPAQVAQERADRIADRMWARLSELDLERKITPAPPEVRGGALIIPRGLLETRSGRKPLSRDDQTDAETRTEVELIAVEAVMAAERALDREPVDRGAEKLGYDVESRDRDGHLHFIEVKGRYRKARAVSLTKGEILFANNNPERHTLAIVLVEGDEVDGPHYVRGFDYGQPSFAQTSAQFNLAALLAAAEEPS